MQSNISCTMYLSLASRLISSGISISEGQGSARQSNCSASCPCGTVPLVWENHVSVHNAQSRMRSLRRSSESQQNLLDLAVHILTVTQESSSSLTVLVTCVHTLMHVCRTRLQRCERLFRQHGLFILSPWDAILLNDPVLTHIARSRMDQRPPRP